MNESGVSASVREPPTAAGAIGAPLLAWFAHRQRDLPWRRDYSPYQVWISEIMLQQTQVRTMLPYYQRWLECFPDTSAVAAAGEDELLKAWEGLGYYSRVINIQRTARILLDRFGGELPNDRRSLLALPGIGPYTAGAILGLAFNQPVAAVDGNVKRVLARLFDLDLPSNSPTGHRAITELATSLIPEGQARLFNQALMELGALICLPRRPACERCPVAGTCRALASGRVAERPVRASAKPTRAIAVAVGVLMRDGKIFIQKRAATGLMPGLWEFPGGKIEPGETVEAALAREFMEELHLKIKVGARIAVIRHAYTSYRVLLHAHMCAPTQSDQAPIPMNAVEYRWAAVAELDLYPFPAANKRLIQMITAGGAPTV